MTTSRIAWTQMRVPQALAPMLEQFVQMTMTGDSQVLALARYDIKDDHVLGIAGTARKGDIPDTQDTAKILCTRLNDRKSMRDIA
jgi:hypothetical protein